MGRVIKDLAIRYLGLTAAILLSGSFYYLLLPLTLYPVYIYLKLFFPVIIQNSSIISGEKTIEIIRACVGTSAIMLLLALNLATPAIKPLKRIYLFISGLTLFLIFNWIRIFLLSVLFLGGSLAFNQIHLVTWYFGSTIAVAIIWVASAKAFKIKEMPFISDAVYLFKKIK